VFVLIMCMCVGVRLCSHERTGARSIVRCDSTVCMPLRFFCFVTPFASQLIALYSPGSQLREEIAAAKRNLEEMDTVTEEDSSEMAKYDLLVKRDQDMTAFIEAFPASRAGILAEQQRAQDTVVLLLEDISKGLEDSANMPSQEAHADMVDAKVRVVGLCVVCGCPSVRHDDVSLRFTPRFAVAFQF
jgi:hypothetical protein